MHKLLPVIAVCVVASVLGGVVSFWLMRPREASPNPPAVLEKVREVARLETLQLTLHKKVSFEPDPDSADSLWGEVANWVRYTVRKPQGRAIVFAQVELGLDLERLDASRIRLEGSRAEVVLPPIEAQVQLLPGETEIIGSNLDSGETAQLFERAREAFEREVMADRELQEKARHASERAIRALLITLGYREVVFLDQPRAAHHTG